MTALMRLTGDRQRRLASLREWEAIPEEIKKARSADLPAPDDWVAQLSVVSDLAREKFVRHRIWWLSNDHLRRGPDAPEEAMARRINAKVARENVHRLLALYEHDSQHQVERGELLRQLGRFDEAVAVLNAVRPDGWSEVRASRIQRLAAAHDSALTIVPE